MRGTRCRKIKKLEATEFRRLTGVKPGTFLEMVAILRQAETTRMSRGGKPHRLAIEDRLLMAIEYLRECRLKAIGSHTSQQIDQKIVRAPVACVFNLRNVLQLIIDRFNKRSFSYQ